MGSNSGCRSARQAGTSPARARSPTSEGRGSESRWRHGEGVGRAKYSLTSVRGQRLAGRQIQLPFLSDEIMTEAMVGLLFDQPEARSFIDPVRGGKNAL